MSASSKPSSTQRTAFTLTELLIVITLIVIILGIAIPTLSTLTGSRSTESAKNQLSAMLGRARGLAIKNGVTIGVAVYVDPVTGRTSLALVQMTGPGQAWTYAPPSGITAYPIYAPNGAVISATNNPGVQYQVGDVVYRLADSSTSLNWSGNTATNDPTETDGRKTVKTFVCTQNHTAATGNAPGTTGGDLYWNWMVPDSIDLVPGDQGDVELLPNGVAVELLNDSASTTTNGTDQYVHTGVILFDSTGKVMVSSVVIVPGSTLYNTLVPLTWSGTRNYIPKISSVNQQLIYSSVGLALYDSTAIVDQPFYTSNTATTAADLNLQMTTNQTPLPTQAIKTQQDNWISNNAQFFFVSRNSGALLKAE